LHQRWVAFERNLLDHLDSEDRSLFSVVAQAHRNEIEALRADHDGIRALAAEVSVAFDAGNLKSGELDALLVLLQQHAEREDQSLYQWLEDDEGICAQRGLAVMVKRYLRAAELLESHNQTDPG
jgi:iron-sulfur cluster repair protein YtfE (RIC family)